MDLNGWNYDSDDNIDYDNINAPETTNLGKN